MIELLLLSFGLFLVSVEACCDPENKNPGDPLVSFHQTFLQQVNEGGFEKAFRSNVRTFAEFAYKDPKGLSCCIDIWVKADKSISLTNANRNSVARAKAQAVANELNYAHPVFKVPRIGLSSVDLGSDKNIPDVIPVSHVSDEPVPGVVESDGKPVKVLRNKTFVNWGGTVRNVPRFTFVPKTKVGVINIVKFAKKEGIRVRAAGARHSWSDVFGAPNEIMISMLEPEAAVPDNPDGFPSDSPQNTELEIVRFNGTFTDSAGVEHGLIRMGGAATAEHFREWALSEKGGNWMWMLPALPILVSITSAGWTQVICHGSGISHKTVSDLVVEVVIVNYEGNLQTIRDKELLRAVSGGFGLLGIVVEQVFVADPLKIADFFPKKVPTVLGVPPVLRSDVPKNDDFSVANVTDAQLEDARRKFEEDCLKFYAEWFWFPFQKEVWANAWDTSEQKNATDRPVYPDAAQVEEQKIESALAKIFQDTLLKDLPPKIQAELLGFAAVEFLPAGELIRTSVVDAVHFRRGINLLPVRDSEIELEIPPRSDGKPDFSVCQKAWWMAISAVYEALPDVPMRTTLEMRIIGGSNVTMSTQRGYNHGTCSIEVLTSALVTSDDWANFILNVVNRWSTLNNTVTGRPLKMRPHFAKEWPTKIRGAPITNYLKKEYATAIPEFRNQMNITAAQGGYTLQNAFSLFGNDAILNFVGK